MQIFRHLTVNNIKLKRFEFPRELTMEAYLVENPDVLILDDDDLSSASIINAEVPISNCRKDKSQDGRIDLLAVYGQSTIGVLELKLGELNDHHLSQIEDYLSDTNQLVEIVKNEINEKDFNFVGILVGTSIRSELATKIRNGYTVNDQIPIAALTLNRYRGEDNNIYIVTDTIFQNVSRKFDRTKYLFNDELYGKNRLVLAVIKNYAENNPEITFSELERAFPKKLQGSMGCFATDQEAINKFETTGYKRYFISPDEIIQIKDSKVSVCTQWGIGNIDKFIEKAKFLGFKIDNMKE